MGKFDFFIQLCNVPDMYEIIIPWKVEKDIPSEAMNI